MSSLSKFIVPAAIAAGALFVPATSYAIPAWTHATGTPCNACHFGASNRLTKMGFDFLSRGHRLIGQESITPDNVQDINMLHYVSLAARGNLNIRQGHNNANPAASSPSTNFSGATFELYAGGPLVGKTSFFVTDTLSGGTVGDAEVQYVSSLQSHNFWTARAGQFSPEVMWISGIVPGGSAAPVNRAIGVGNPEAPGTTNRGVSFTYDAETMPGRDLRAELGIVNGGTAATDPNNYKDQYASVSQELDPYSSQLGLFFYNGRNRTSGVSARLGTPPATTALPPYSEDFNTVGVLGQFMRDTYGVHGAYFRSSAENAPQIGGRRKPISYYMEGDYNVTPNGTAFVRFDRENDQTPALIVAPVTGAKNWTLGYYFRYHDFSRFGVTASDNQTYGTSRTHTKALSFSWSFYL